MATAVLLRPHDSLQRRLPQDMLSLTSSPRNPNPNQKQNSRRKRSPVANFQENRDRSSCGCGGGDRSVVVKGQGANLVMGQVKILKRGEKLSGEDSRPKPKIEEERFDLALGSTNRLGPDPETVKKQVRISDSKVVTYAGATFTESPPPSSVPLPAFLRRCSGGAAEPRRVHRFNSV